MGELQAQLIAGLENQGADAINLWKDAQAVDKLEKEVATLKEGVAATDKLQNERDALKNQVEVLTKKTATELERKNKELQARQQQVAKLEKKVANYETLKRLRHPTVTAHGDGLSPLAEHWIDNTSEQYVIRKAGASKLRPDAKTFAPSNESKTKACPECKDDNPEFPR